VVTVPRPDKRTGPEVTTPQARRNADTSTSPPNVQRDPVPLADAIAELIELSDERDLWIRWLLDAQRQAYAAGHADGFTEGWQECEWDRQLAWHELASEVARGGEVEHKRWGPGGRARFGEPRPGDYGGSAA